MLHLGLEPLDDVSAALGEKMQRSAGENDAESERHIGRILLEYPHDMRGIAALEQVSEIKA
jgi:hypothetical protein